MAGTAAAAAAVFTVTRTSSEPASARALTWATVAATSAVSVLVIDWTTIGAPPPMTTSPTRAARVRCRSMVRGPGVFMASSGQLQPGDVLPGVTRQIDDLPAIDHGHRAGVADD